MNSFWCDRMQVLRGLAYHGRTAATPACASSHLTATVSAPRPARACSTGCLRRARTSSACRKPRRRNTSSVMDASGRPAITAATSMRSGPATAASRSTRGRSPTGSSRFRRFRNSTPRAAISSSSFGGLSVVSLYLPSGRRAMSARPRSTASSMCSLPYLKKLGRARPRLRVLRRQQHRAQEIDLKNWKSEPEELGVPARRARLDRRLFGELKWVDAFREVDPRPDQYTWWSNRGQAWSKNVGWRIDYQIATPALRRPRASGVDLHDDSCFSDHAPLTMDYDCEYREAHRLDSKNQDRARPEKLQRGGPESAHADLCFYRLYVRTASLRTISACSRLVTRRRCGTRGDRLFRAGAVPLHLEIPVVSGHGSFHACRSWAPSRLDAVDANRLAGVDGCHGIHQARPVSPDRCLPVSCGGVLQCQPGHRA